VVLACVCDSHGVFNIIESYIKEVGMLIPQEFDEAVFWFSILRNEAIIYQSCS